MIEEESDFDEVAFEKLQEYIYNEFPNCPFSISCVESVEEFDKVFTNEKTIFIYDDRANSWVFDNLEPEEKAPLFNYTKVSTKGEKPITLRDVLNAMIEDPHYRDELVLSDNHQFLELFEKSEKSDIQYTCFWGS